MSRESPRRFDSGRPAALMPLIQPGELADRLLTWFRGRHRDVPGRGETDPYRIWVVEVMAQQTRMVTVRERYHSFLKLFPDVGALAAAELDEVLKAWEGLGYYARARHLHRAARQVVEEHGGDIPAQPEALRKLPGVGPYTAGAVASFAFGVPEPAVDGNARRVLARLFDLAKPTQAVLRDSARRLLEARPADAALINQAIMDLGSSICSPRAPLCGTCPVAESCLALARDTVSQRPPRHRRKVLPHEDVAVGLLRRDGRVLIQRRPAEGLLGGLWEFPGGKVEAGEEPAEAVVRELAEELGVEVTTGELAARIEHAYSHLRITMYAYHVELVAGEPTPTTATAWTWARLKELRDYAFPAANRAILASLAGDSSF